MLNQSSAWLRHEIQGLLDERVAEKEDENFWREPLLAVAAADDPLFGEFRRVVSPDHAMPEEILPGARAVVVFFLPFQRWVGRENDAAGEYAARGWATAYVATNQLIRDINIRLKQRIEELGHRAGITPATHNFDEEQLISRWSHKHLGYVAGLGTFGLNHLLITEAGCCGRLGSFVTDLPLAPTPRPTVEYCLAKAGGECSACVSKCSYDALFESRYDRHQCYRQCLVNDRYHSDLPLVDVCGKCACEVPCSYRAPS